MRALVMGFGAATMIRQFSEDGAYVVGLDYSIAALKWLKRQTTAQLVCADIRRLPFARSNFDAIYCDALLGHIARSEFDETVRGIRDALRPGGVLGVRLKLGEGEGLQARALLLRRFRRRVRRIDGRFVGRRGGVGQNACPILT